MSSDKFLIIEHEKIICLYISFLRSGHEKSTFFATTPTKDRKVGCSQISSAINQCLCKATWQSLINEKDGPN